MVCYGGCSRVTVIVDASQVLTLESSVLRNLSSVTDYLGDKRLYVGTYTPAMCHFYNHFLA